MSRKLVVMILIVSFVIMSWSTSVIAEEKAQKSKEAQVQERRKKLERLAGESRKSEKPGGESAEIQTGIRRAKGNLAELRQAVKDLKEEGGDPDRLEELQKKIGDEERKLAKFNDLLEKRRAGAKRKRQSPRTKLTFLPLKHAKAQNLGKIIQEFISPQGIVVGDPETNILVIKATPNDLEIASAIIKNLDIPGRRVARDQPRRCRDSREGAAREEVFFGKVLESGKKSLTIKTRNSGETVTLYVPPRRRDDGTSVPNEELSVHVASFDVGANVKVQWRQGDERRLIQRVTRIEE